MNDDLTNNSTNPNSTTLNSTDSKMGAIETSRKILAAAKEQAACIVEEAKKNAVCIIDDALKSAKKQSSKEIANTLLNIERERIALMENSQNEILSMVLAISEEVIGESLKLQPESIITRIKRAISFARSSRLIQLVVNPQEEHLVTTQLNALSEFVTSCKDLSLKTDNQIKLGDARLETDIATVTSNLSEHLTRIKEHFKQLSIAHL